VSQYSIYQWEKKFSPLAALPGKASDFAGTPEQIEASRSWCVSKIGYWFTICGFSNATIPSLLAYCPLTVTIFPASGASCAIRTSRLPIRT
jgi:hypothetical protein